MNITKAEITKAFTEWYRLYRESPEQFEDFVVSLLKGDPETYGESCTQFFIFLIKELRNKEKVSLEDYV